MSLNLYPGVRTALFIDGPNAYASMKSLGTDIDYKRLREHFESSCVLVRCSYYTASYEDSEGVNNLRPLMDWLSYNGFQLITKPAKEFTDEYGRRKIRGNLDVEITVDVMEAVHQGRIEHIVLFSGDGDFATLAEAVQRRGVKFTVVSTFKTHPPMVADELRRQADEFVEMGDIMKHIGRNN